MFDQIEAIIFDFDGVLIDSMQVRERGFRKILAHYPQALVEQLIEFHRKNGGLSRYHKIKHFYTTILKQEISDHKLQTYADQFSAIMRKELIKKKYLIEDAVNFIKKSSTRYAMHIASGSDQEELQYLCTKLKIGPYFTSILGSPKSKKELVGQILTQHEYKPESVILIGDSLNDYEAANHHHVPFYGYNNPELAEIGLNYIDQFA